MRQRVAASAPVMKYLRTSSGADSGWRLASRRVKACSRLPSEKATLAKRAEETSTRGAARIRHSSITRLVAPMALAGLAALSDETAK